MAGAHQAPRLVTSWWPRFDGSYLPAGSPDGRGPAVAAARTPAKRRGSQRPAHQPAAAGRRLHDSGEV